MIKNLIAFIKRRYREIIIIVIVSLIAINLSSSIIYEKNGKISKIFMQIFSPVSDVISSKTGKLTSKDSIVYSKEEKKILELEEENASLRNKLIAQTQNSNDLANLEQLKGVLNFIDDKYNPIPISARIIAKNDGRFFTSFTVTAGSVDGVKSDSIVVNELGLVGRVYEVSDNYSKVVTIMDNKANVSFEVLENPDERGILTQEINISENETYIQDQVNGYMFNIYSNIKQGDTIITSGMGIYPSGIAIGKISNIISDDQNLLKYVQISPFVNFKNIDFVSILNPKDME